MFLPSHLTYRFRYSPFYVPSEFFADPTGLTNRKGYIVHANTRKRPHLKDVLMEFLPIREVTIRTAKQFGEFLWLQFELGDWVIYKDPSDRRPNEHHKMLRDVTPKRSRNIVTLTLYEAPTLKLETLSDDPSGASERVASNWMRIVNRMEAFEGHKKYKPTYLKLVALRNTTCESAVIPGLISGLDSGYNLRSGNDYRLEVLEYSPYRVPDKPFPMKLKVDENRIVPLVDEATIFGGYDFLLTTFRPVATLSPYRTILHVQVESTNKMKVTVDLHAKILRSWRRVISAIFVAVGIGLSTVAPSIAEGHLTVDFALVGTLVAVAGFISLLWSGERL
jgi:hypothetical protein